jgi:hypothetical protein
MGLSGSTRPIIGFILAIGITLTLPYLAFGASSVGSSGRIRAPGIHRQHSFSRPFPRTFGAAHSFGGSRRFRAPGIHGQPFFSRPFNRFGWFGVGGVIDEQPVIIIQHFQSPAATEPKEPDTNRIYVQPRWVDGGYGVEVLQPGYWTNPKQAAER